MNARILFVFFWAAGALAAPGADEIIREEEILRRMEREIGISVQETSASAQREEPKPQDPRLFSGRIVLSGGRDVRGEIVLSQKEIVLVRPTLRRIRIASAASLEFVSFRLISGRFVPAKAIVVLKDGSRIEGEVRSEDWLSVPVESAGCARGAACFFQCRVRGGGDARKRGGGGCAHSH
jgi:hypothetical protein